MAEKDDKETIRHEQPQPLELDTGERLGSTARAVGQGIAHKLQGEHETQKGARQTVAADEVKNLIENWPAAQKNIAEQMIAKYGFPNEATPTKLFWYGNGPWKRTELSGDAVVHNWPTVHSDFLTQVIDYRVPPEMFHLIAMFDGSILCDRTRGEVAARCDTESANVLGINLGRSAPYAEQLLFEVPQGGTEDLDKSEISGAILRQTGGKIKDVVTGREEEATDRLTGKSAAKGG